MKTKIVWAGIIACIGCSAQAQNVKTEEPGGKAIVQVFGNFHSGFGKENNNRGFELERSYLGYEYNLGKGLKVKGVMDMGATTEDNERVAYIKNAMVQWTRGNFSLNGGLISTTQFNLQEKFWGYRYIMKSFQDQYKFGSSADLGISDAYKLADWISADAIIVNGEGYKKVQKNDGLNYGLGVTLTPIRGLQIRVYGALNETADKEGEDVTNLATFIGYKNDRLTIGAEYNLMQNYKNVKDQNLYGFSIFTSVKLSEKTDLYARFDDLSSKDDWNKMKTDESAAIIGAQFKAAKYVKIAPNFRVNIPKAHETDEIYSGYISCYFGF